MHQEPGLRASRKYSDEDANQNTRLNRVEAKAKKMFASIDDILKSAITAIDNAEATIEENENQRLQVLNQLHEQMIEIKPLKGIRDQFNEFYRKLSGFGKSIESATLKKNANLETLKIFNDNDYRALEQAISDHYLKQKNYEASLAFSPDNNKKAMFQECELIKGDILKGSFDRAVEWAEVSFLDGKERQLSYEIKKMKIVSLVKEERGAEAMDFCRKQMSAYGDLKSEQISMLIGYIMASSQSYWGVAADQISMLKMRYKQFEQINLPMLAHKFQAAYFKINSIRLKNPITQCHQMGLLYRDKILEQINFLPQISTQMANPHKMEVLPFSIQKWPEHNFHSQFFCPVSKEVYGEKDKCLILVCGHMISQSAYNKIIETRNIRRKLKCPVCQDEQSLENKLEVRF